MDEMDEIAALLSADEIIGKSLFDIIDQDEDFQCDLSREIMTDCDDSAILKFNRQARNNQALDRLPKRKEALHIVTSGNFDLFLLIPMTARLMNNVVEELWISTWSINRENVNKLMQLHDDGIIASISMITGHYFASRESEVYKTLKQYICSRKQRYQTFDTHAKIILMKNNCCDIVIESSANMTKNPRVEQVTVFNDPELLEFHKKWIHAALEKGEKGHG